MAITVISYAPVGHSYFHTPSPLRGTPSILEGELASSPSKIEGVSRSDGGV